mmetsp:Transcript_79402/g.236574  ORF Transcript_79402/g.236574 Transcript_79402/m.236574 type:complete len:405 (+) Transcript_79402:542-1756(+)
MVLKPAAQDVEHVLGLRLDGEGDLAPFVPELHEGQLTDGDQRCLVLTAEGGKDRVGPEGREVDLLVEPDLEVDGDLLQEGDLLLQDVALWAVVVEPEVPHDPGRQAPWDVALLQVPPQTVALLQAVLQALPDLQHPGVEEANRHRDDDHPDDAADVAVHVLNAVCRRHVAGAEAGLRQGPVQGHGVDGKDVTAIQVLDRLPTGAAVEGRRHGAEVASHVVTHEEVADEDVGGLYHQQVVDGHDALHLLPGGLRRPQDPHDAQPSDDAPEPRRLCRAGRAAALHELVCAAHETDHQVCAQNDHVAQHPGLAVPLGDLPAPHLHARHGAVLVAREEGAHEVQGPIGEDDQVHDVERVDLASHPGEAGDHRNKDGVVQKQGDADHSPGGHKDGVRVQDAREDVHRFV